MQRQSEGVYPSQDPRLPREIRDRVFGAIALTRSEAFHPDAAGAAIGSAAGLAAMLLVDLWCPVAFLPHLLLGHLAPIAVIVFLGMRLGSRLLAPA